MGPNSTRSLRFDREDQVYIVVRNVAVAMSTKDYSLNATQICNVAGLDAIYRNKLHKAIKRESITIRIKNNIWVPFVDGVFLCQLLKIIDALRPLLSSAPLDLPSQANNYLMEKRTPAKPTAPDGYTTVSWGDKEIWHIPSESLINLTQLFKIQGIKRSQLNCYLQKNPLTYKRVVKGRVASGTYGQYSAARILCQHFGVSEGPIDKITGKESNAKPSPLYQFGSEGFEGESPFKMLDLELNSEVFVHDECATLSRNLIDPSMDLEKDDEDDDGDDGTKTSTAGSLTAKQSRRTQARTNIRVREIHFRVASSLICATDLIKASSKRRWPTSSILGYYETPISQNDFVSYADGLALAYRLKLPTEKLEHAMSLNMSRISIEISKDEAEGIDKEASLIVHIWPSKSRINATNLLAVRGCSRKHLPRLLAGSGIHSIYCRAHGMQGTFIGYAGGFRLANALGFSEVLLDQIRNAIREGWLGPMVQVQHEPKVDLVAVKSKMADVREHVQLEEFLLPSAKTPSFACSFIEESKKPSGGDNLDDRYYEGLDLEDESGILRDFDICEDDDEYVGCDEC